MLALPESFGLCKKVIRWITSYLTGKTYGVQVEPTLSQETRITSAAPQGSVIGATYFFSVCQRTPDCHKCSNAASLQRLQDGVTTLTRRPFGTSLSIPWNSTISLSDRHPFNYPLPLEVRAIPCRSLTLFKTFVFVYPPFITRWFWPIFSRLHKPVCQTDGLDWMQRLASRLVTGFRPLPYEERLRRLGLHSLHWHSIMYILIQIY